MGNGQLFNEGGGASVQRKLTVPDELLHAAQFSQPGHADLCYGLQTGNGAGYIGVMGALGWDARPVEAGGVRPALDIRFRGQRLRSASTLDDGAGPVRRRVWVGVRRA